MGTAGTGEWSNLYLNFRLSESFSASSMAFLKLDGPSMDMKKSCNVNKNKM